VQEVDRHDHHHRHDPHQDDFYYPNHLNTKKVFIIMQIIISFLVNSKDRTGEIVTGRH